MLKQKVKYVDLYSAFNALPLPVSRRWSPQANPIARHSANTARPRIRVGVVSRDMTVYSPNYAGYSFSLGRLKLSRPGCMVPRRGGLPVQSGHPPMAL